ncbi:hypothetical protein NXW84_06590 [Bacteroides fragilis]|nr:hypothetical protein NXW84_06590 [Bacteroides fragilis]
MNDDKTITAAIETSNVTALLAAYRKFTSSSRATTDEFFRFITTPTPEREEFLALYCSSTSSVSGTIIQTNYNAL